MTSYHIVQAPFYQATKNSIYFLFLKLIFGPNEERLNVTHIFCHQLNCGYQFPKKEKTDLAGVRY